MAEFAIGGGELQPVEMDMRLTVVKLAVILFPFLW